MRLGEWNTQSDKDCYDSKCNDKAVDVKVENIMFYPNYTKRHFTKGDIALLRLEEPVNFTGKNIITT